MVTPRRAPQAPGRCRPPGSLGLGVQHRGGGPEAPLELSRGRKGPSPGAGPCDSAAATGRVAGYRSPGPSPAARLSGAPWCLPPGGLSAACPGRWRVLSAPPAGWPEVSLSRGSGGRGGGLLCPLDRLLWVTAAALGPESAPLRAEGELCGRLVSFQATSQGWPPREGPTSPSRSFRECHGSWLCAR